MIGGMDHFPTTESAVTALRALASEYGRAIEVTHDIGADQTSRRSAVGVGVTTTRTARCRTRPMSSWAARPG